MKSIKSDVMKTSIVHAIHPGTCSTSQPPSTSQPTVGWLRDRGMRHLQSRVWLCVQP